ncbi:hypothetical protein LTR10_019161 [Elasticomyces elasticus]|uniref:Uncharacterized protein n=1 Tax=Exophiala sideris TaxID=1016849 RepID=A0ABR0J8Q6_9EURO|nr:hypothetical protein LTR10_019161 [Elasticomyces elasticus]KAK5025481.1 hypothetical protein LTR13_010445 [Exophiala sideris]KAK5029753.1 hypothetical protein LTS07_005477 [Exophiala sideris]KAK5058485.1 hypothetical protein LTR69_006890 [Exophiala sideris]KAK5178542.1 hypothetical protein LTR44_008913 [Eurotiomycetes sp. CCFEE 6388]
MAPNPRNMFYRQQFDGPFSHNNGPGNGPPKAAIIGIAVTVGVILLAVATYFLLRFRRRRNTNSYKPADAQGGFNVEPPSQIPSKEDTAGLPGKNSPAPPAIVAWDAEHAQAGSTQNGFQYGMGMGIQRPASAASVGVPPPRYEEATARPGLGHGRHQSDSGLRPLLLAQGEAASYYNDSAREEQDLGERGRSVSRERSTGTRARSVSKFREEGMVDLGLNSPIHRS